MDPAESQVPLATEAPQDPQEVQLDPLVHQPRDLQVQVWVLLGQLVTQAILVLQALRGQLVQQARLLTQVPQVHRAAWETPVLLVHRVRKAFKDCADLPDPQVPRAPAAQTVWSLVQLAILDPLVI